MIVGVNIATVAEFKRRLTDIRDTDFETQRQLQRVEKLSSMVETDHHQNKAAFEGLLDQLQSVYDDIAAATEQNTKQTARIEAATGRLIAFYESIDDKRLKDQLADLFDDLRKYREEQATPRGLEPGAAG